MANVDKLKEAGIIKGHASLSPEDHDVINRLTPDEVSALISVKGKLTPEFEKKHLSSSSGKPGEPSMGIVF